VLQNYLAPDLSNLSFLAGAITVNLQKKHLHSMGK